ncbi:hypothetical protein [Melittangium boletus]|uniref:Lipoprotein n=1 Tax=Melittangium boletus DSM 14713 TaxID=1294270 RepID=A0A250I8H0_9BACT|nr:hypothetical protein [Melittangium boletus]ATB28169.1 hypothetical protein MEBOL_001615 [Melittangium boletus DSM 14713]
MMRKGGFFFAGALLIGALGVACGEPGKPKITAALSEAWINAEGGATNITFIVVDESGEKGTGVARVTTKLGEFGDQSNNTLVTLEDGSVTVPFSCAQARYPDCAKGLAKISIKWRDTSGSVTVYVGPEGKKIQESKGSKPPPPPPPSADPNVVEMLDLLSTSDVYLHGVLSGNDITRPAVSPVVQPMRLFAGLPHDASVIKLRGDGRLVYVLDGNVYEAHADAFTQDSGGKPVYPGAFEKNDVLLSTPKCMGEVTDVHGLPQSSELYYKCGATGPYYNKSGTEVIPANYRLLAVSGANKLTFNQSTHRLTLFDSAKTARNMHSDANPKTDFMVLETARARGGGFDMIYMNGVSRQLWRVSLTGSYSRVGEYPDTDKDPTAKWDAANFTYWVQDASGNIYYPAASPGKSQRDSVIRLSLGRGGEVVYDSSKAPADAGEQWPPRFFNLMTYLSGVPLFTGP